MGIITANNDGKKLWGDENCIYFKNLDSCYKLHYRVHRGTTDYDEERVDIVDGQNNFTVHAAASVARYMELEFFDDKGNKFLPYNIEFKNLLAPDPSGNGIVTILADGTIRIILMNKLDSQVTYWTHAISMVWDDEIEEIDSTRKVTINFDFAQ